MNLEALGSWFDMALDLVRLIWRRRIRRKLGTSALSGVICILADTARSRNVSSVLLDPLCYTFTEAVALVIGIVVRPRYAWCFGGFRNDDIQDTRTGNRAHSNIVVWYWCSCGNCFASGASDKHRACQRALRLARAWSWRGRTGRLVAFAGRNSTRSTTPVASLPPRLTIRCSSALLSAPVVALTTLVLALRGGFKLQKASRVKGVRHPVVDVTIVT